MSDVKYNKRVWLNPETSHYTGSVTCFDGVVSNQGKPEERYAFIELRDCHGRVRIHMDRNSGNEREQLVDFRQKLIKLQLELEWYIEHLKEELRK